MMRPGGLHGVIQGQIVFLLKQWARVGPGGVVGSESGFVLARDPDTVRGPDVFYIGPSRIPPGGPPVAFWEGPPDLAVEVVSPSNTPAELRDWVGDFLAAGTTLVWVVHPLAGTVEVHRSGQPVRTLTATDRLTGFDVLPGFDVAVPELFA